MFPKILMHFDPFRKILEREDELFIVGNILKSLEVSEEKVKHILLYLGIIILDMT